MRTLTEIRSITVPIVDLSQKTRVLWIDNARIVACFFAVCLHVSAGVVSWVENLGSLSWWIGNMFDSCARWSLPVFVMISGVLLLDTAKDEPISTFYKKRVSRVFIPLIFWTIFYLSFRYFGKPFVSGEQVSISSLLSSVMYGLPYYHLWYLYMVVGLYFFVPFFVRIIRQSSYNELLILCIALFIFSMAGNAFVSYYTPNNIPAFFTFIYYLPYFLAGYLISRTEFSPPIRILWITFALSGILNSVGYYNSLGADGTTKGYFCNCLSITVVPMAISVMFLLKRFTMPIINPAVSGTLALLSLGIYLIHPFFINVLIFFGIAAKSFNALISIPLITALVFTLSLIASFIIGRIPGFNKVIGLRPGSSQIELSALRLNHKKTIPGG